MFIYRFKKLKLVWRNKRWRKCSITSSFFSSDAPSQMQLQKISWQKRQYIILITFKGNRKLLLSRLPRCSLKFSNSDFLTVTFFTPWGQRLMSGGSWFIYQYISHSTGNVLESPITLYRWPLKLCRTLIRRKTTRGNLSICRSSIWLLPCAEKTGVQTVCTYGENHLTFR